MFSSELDKFVFDINFSFKKKFNLKNNKLFQYILASCLLLLFIYVFTKGLVNKLKMSSKLARLFTSVDARIQKNMSDQMKAKWNHEAGDVINYETIALNNLTEKK